jgi:argininosuccinate lyase
MENTGRIRKLLTPSARRILFAAGHGTHAEELWPISRVDQAHLLMLMERGIIEREAGARLLAAIGRLQQQDYSPLEGLEATRGVFLLYEDYLIASEGSEIGGVLQTARSRNDLNATVLKLKLRQPYLKILREGLRLQAVLLNRIRRFASVVMPVYTHGQAAMPTTYGHYLAGVAAALSRDLEGIFTAAHDLQSCPLGAGAVAGTSFPINVSRTAELLGFTTGPLNSLDAVASRDLVLRFLSAASVFSITLGRMATDFLQWTTAEFGFLGLPDELTGSSSAMPQKRNPFILEHVQGRSASLIGAFVQAAAPMHAMPFTNCIAVGTEAIKPAWEALRSLAEMMVLTRLVVAAARPHQKAMLRRARDGFTVATEYANRAVREAKLDFRTAHRLIGQAVLKSIECSENSLDQTATEMAASTQIPVSFQRLDPSSVVQSLEYGGGPGPCSMETMFAVLHERSADQRRRKRAQERAWQHAEALLEEKVKSALHLSMPS